MRDLKSWAMLFCTISVILGILQMILPQKEQSMGIKLVMGLYILVTILKPTVSINWGQLLMEPKIAVQQTVPLDFDSLVQDQSQQQLQKLLQAEMEKAELAVIVQQVWLNYDSEHNTAEVTAVKLQGKEQPQAEQIAKKFLGDAITVEWIEKDEAA